MWKTRSRRMEEMMHRQTLEVLRIAEQQTLAAQQMAAALEKMITLFVPSGSGDITPIEDTATWVDLFPSESKDE